MKKPLFSILSLALALPGMSFAAPLVGSTFQDSGTGAPGRTTVVTTNNSNLTPWYLSTSTTSSRLEVVDDSGSGGLGKSMIMSRLEAGLTNFSSTSILNGQSLSISFSYRYEVAPPVWSGKPPDHDV